MDNSTNNKMGGAISIETPDVIVCEDRGGSYTIKKYTDRWVLQWGTIQRGVEVHVFRQGSIISAHLVRTNLSKRKHKHFDCEQDGNVDILVANNTIEIANVFLCQRGICRKSVTKTLFAAIRIYCQEFKQPVKSGIVNISSKEGIRAYHCYRKAFKRNAFESMTAEPSKKEVEDYLVLFTRKIYNTPIIK